MTTLFALTRDINGYNAFVLPDSGTKYSATLAAGVAQTVTAPTDFKNGVAIFNVEVGTNFWVAINNTAAVPVGATFAATNSNQNIPGLLIKGGDVLSFITSDTSASIGVMFYAFSD